MMEPSLQRYARVPKMASKEAGDAFEMWVRANAYRIPADAVDVAANGLRGWLVS